jgi:ribulose-5-phosphate 4-epimerase/fuculose-1-phosphate aldolase
MTPRITSFCAVSLLALVVNLTAQGGRVAVSPEDRQLIEDLVIANRILANEGILDGLGHVSVRRDQRRDHFLLSRDQAPGLVTADDVMEFDLDGNAVDPQGRRMYGERFIHSSIYKARPDVTAIVHAHTPSILPFTTSNVSLRPMYNQAAFLLPGVPVFEIRRVEGATGMLVRDVRVGAALAQTLGDKTVALMRGHGLVVVAPSLPEAVARSVYVDINARVQTQAIALGGTISYIGPQDVTAPTSAEPASAHSSQLGHLEATGNGKVSARRASVPS